MINLCSFICFEQNFLLLEEIESDYHQIHKKSAIINNEEQKPEKLGINMLNASAKWTPNSITDTLFNIKLQVKPGKLCAVIGPVGAGKVSFI